jgi:hypothetical protein
MTKRPDGVLLGMPLHPELTEAEVRWIGNETVNFFSSNQGPLS